MRAAKHQKPADASRSPGARTFAATACIVASLALSPAWGAGNAEPALIYVESQRSRTFGPQRVTPAGTVFRVKVVGKGDNDALRLHRCGDENCKRSETVKVWQPGEYRSGDELTWRAERDGTYYFWMEDPRNERSLEATSHWFVGNRTRIAFDSGAVLEVWYALP